VLGRPAWGPRCARRQAGGRPAASLPVPTLASQPEQPQTPVHRVPDHCHAPFENLQTRPIRGPRGSRFQTPPTGAPARRSPRTLSPSRPSSLRPRTRGGSCTSTSHPCSPAPHRSWRRTPAPPRCARAPRRSRRRRRLTRRCRRRWRACCARCGRSATGDGGSFWRWRGALGGGAVVQLLPGRVSPVMDHGCAASGLPGPSPHLATIVQTSCTVCLRGRSLNARITRNGLGGGVGQQDHISPSAEIPCVTVSTQSVIFHSSSQSKRARPAGCPSSDHNSESGYYSSPRHGRIMISRPRRTGGLRLNSARSGG
jgi:hypothetical protein